MKYNIAVIAAGGRSRGVVGNLFKESTDIKIVSVFDPDREMCKLAKEQWNQPDMVFCDTYQEAIQRDDVNWVMVFSPNSFHKEHILCAFNAGKHVFSEKPLATSIEDCQEIYEAHKKSNLQFATGFVLRYAPLYTKVHELLEKGYIGKLLSIDANENISPDHGAYIMQNWRRFKKYAGPHILEKCCHDLDLINWFAGSVPSYVASFAGRDFFIPENKDYDKMTHPDGRKIFGGWEDPHAADSAFTSEKDMMDNQVAIMQYRNGIRVMFQATVSNAIPERRMYFSGTEGTMIAELYTGILRCKRIDDGEQETIYNYSGGGGHAGGDSYIMKELYDTMLNDTLPKCGGDEGLESSVVAMAIEKAKDEMKVFDLEPVWKKLDR
ncbi:MAG: Gfo/Idh/MocA family oxidoreductase [Verrucomicrobiota bacterium]|nr:Gfo/Idh/MocA family oxidoreductase [Verrucomicrobiota bacterium]